MIRRWGLHVALPLFAGLGLYVFFRPNDVRVFSWLTALGLNHAVEALHWVAVPLADRVPYWVRGSGSDFAWAYAFGASLSLVWRRSSASLAAWVWFCLGGAVTAGLELAQAFRVIEGRFDPLDLLVMLAGFGFALYAVGIKAPLFARASGRRAPAAPHA